MAYSQTVKDNPLLGTPVRGIAVYYPSRKLLEKRNATNSRL